MNRAFLGKLVGRMVRAEDRIWAKVLWGKYGRPLVDIKKGRKCVSHVAEYYFLQKLLRLGMNDQRGGSDDTDQCLLATWK